MTRRRNFMMIVGIIALMPHKSVLAAERRSRPLRIATYVPVRMFLPSEASVHDVLLTALELTDKDKGVLASFSNGRSIRLESRAASLSVARARGLTRVSVLPKSLAAWVIDAVWRTLRNRRNRTTYTELRRNFDGFQRHSVLEAVTPLSLHNLVRDTLFRKEVTSVVWNRNALRFEVK